MTCPLAYNHGTYESKAGGNPLIREVKSTWHGYIVRFGNDGPGAVWKAVHHDRS
jgi:hypothetical protein